MNTRVSSKRNETTRNETKHATQVTLLLYVRKISQAQVRVLVFTTPFSPPIVEAALPLTPDKLAAIVLVSEECTSAFSIVTVVTVTLKK